MKGCPSMRKFITAALATLTLASNVLVANVPPAEARNRDRIIHVHPGGQHAYHYRNHNRYRYGYGYHGGDRYHYGYRHHDNGGALAAGVAGLAVGAIIGSALSQHSSGAVASCEAR